MEITIGSATGQNLFLMMYAVCVSATLTTTLPSMFNYGVGAIFTEGIGVFIIRAIFMGLFFVFSSMSFIFGFNYCGSISTKGFISSSLYVLIIIIISMSPWFCDHLARIIVSPFKRKVQIRERKFRYVDLVFVCIYLVIVGCLLLAQKILSSIL
jgi:hypothetical protein